MPPSMSEMGFHRHSRHVGSMAAGVVAQCRDLTLTVSRGVGSRPGTEQAQHAQRQGSRTNSAFSRHLPLVGF